MTDLAGRTALVTGGASGIGLGLVQGLLDRGAHVVLADVDEARAQAASAATGATPVTCDVTDGAAVQALADELDQRSPLSLLVCNAGIGPAAPVADMTEQDWRWMLDVNLWGPLNCLRAFLPIVRRRARESHQGSDRGGHVVLTSSMSALAPTHGLGGYAASKAAATAVFEVLAQELRATGDPVGVTISVPGPTRTSIGASTRHRPEGAGGALSDLDLEAAGHPWIRWRTPEHAAQVILGAVERNELWAVTHPELWSRVEDRVGSLSSAFTHAAVGDS